MNKKAALRRLAEGPPGRSEGRSLSDFRRGRRKQGINLLFGGDWPRQKLSETSLRVALADQTRRVPRAPCAISGSVPLRFAENEEEQRKKSLSFPGF